jgi:hypothetical protein
MDGTFSSWWDAGSALQILVDLLINSSPNDLLVFLKILYHSVVDPDGPVNGKFAYDLKAYMTYREPGRNREDYVLSCYSIKR